MIASAVPGEREGRLAIDLEAIKIKAKGRLADQADQWINRYKEDATAYILEVTDYNEYIAHERGRLRKIYGVEP